MEITNRSSSMNEFGDPTPMPETTVPAMSYIHYQQWGEKLMNDSDALNAGTLFPVLDKPFEGVRAK